MLIPNKLYRLHYAMQDESLQGKPVVFYEMKCFTHGDIQRARVKLLLANGETGQEYLVSQSCIIPFMTK